jgi:hypothetical protein
MITMARKAFTIELTVMGGLKYFIYPDELHIGGIPDNPTTYIGQFIAGNRGPMLRVNTVEDLSGDQLYINPKMIISMRVIYKD